VTNDRRQTDDIRQTDILRCVDKYSYRRNRLRCKLRFRLKVHRNQETV